MKGICKLINEKNEKKFIPKIFDLKVLAYMNGNYQLYAEFPIDICSILDSSIPNNDFRREN